MTDDTPHFNSIPWISTLLADPTFTSTPIPSRIFKPTTEDSLFSTTINTPTTISHCLSQYRNPPPDAKPFSPHSIPTTEIRIFCTLGSDLNGYPGVLHGGIVATLLDECMGLILMFNLAGGQSGMQGPVTAYLNTKFLRPVLTPGSFLVGARVVEESSGRKWKIEGEIKGEDGEVLATGECLYILPRGVSNKL
ncbi:HotDog domain-containing protein [Aspergillus karnatakaensis]|uniref:PaaI family thioesterase n=1 Tax=Aspergillus karnatakaensis TaxID=1810916 RepID=UPI003CCE20C0